MRDYKQSVPTSSLLGSALNMRGRLQVQYAICSSVYKANIFLPNGLSEVYTISLNLIKFSVRMEYFIPIELESDY